LTAPEGGPERDQASFPVAFGILTIGLANNSLRQNMWNGSPGLWRS